MSNNRNVSISIEVQLEEILPDNAFSVFCMEICYPKKSNASRPFLIIVLRLLIGLGR